MDLWGRCGVLVITECSGQDNREMETMCQDIHLLLLTGAVLNITIALFTMY